LAPVVGPKTFPKQILIQSPIISPNQILSYPNHHSINNNFNNKLPLIFKHNSNIIIKLLPFNKFPSPLPPPPSSHQYYHHDDFYNFFNHYNNYFDNGNYQNVINKMITTRSFAEEKPPAITTSAVTSRINLANNNNNKHKLFNNNYLFINDLSLIFAGTIILLQMISFILVYNIEECSPLVLFSWWRNKIS